MYNRILTLLLIFSLAFNIAFVGIWVYNRARPVAAPLGWQPGARRRLGPPPWEAAQLNPEQKRKVLEDWQELNRKTTELCTEVRRQRERLFELMAADEPDEQAIRECEERISAVQKQIHRMALEHMRRTRQLLTPEQRRAWFRMMRTFADRPGRGRRNRGPRPAEDQRSAPGPRPGLRGPSKGLNVPGSPWRYVSFSL